MTRTRPDAFRVKTSGLATADVADILSSSFTKSQDGGPEPVDRGGAWAVYGGVRLAGHLSLPAPLHR
ncbi:MAG: hypothetical protein A2W36_06420 [Chloroflexi bacterium RBG_16_58_14]|nr:MAG: hypothetical protein A2W36_06420 [Chloroflexi bacterium RBG_16_58_14]